MRYPLTKMTWFQAVVVFGLTLGLYHSNGRVLPGGDTVPHRYLPLNIVCSGSIHLENIPLGRVQPNGLMAQPYFLVKGRDGHLYSTFGAAPAIMATPIYAVAAWIDNTFSYQRILRLGKWSASLFMALATVLVFFLGVLLLGHTGGWMLAVVWGWGTSSWSMISQALWQHSAAAPWLAASLLCLILGRQRGFWIPWAGFCLGWATFCRPTNAVIAVPLACYVWIHHRKQIMPFLLLAGVMAVALFSHNMYAFGHFFSFGQIQAGSSLAHWKTGTSAYFVQNISTFAWGWVGILLSPSRGILIYSPVLWFGVAGLWLSWRREGDPLFRWASVGFLGVIVLHACWYDWWGGWVYGYRLPFDGVILLVFGIVPLWHVMVRLRWVSWIFAGTLIFSLWVQAVGAFAYDSVSWNYRPRNVDTHPERLWSIRDSQLLMYLKKPRWVRRIPYLDATPLTLRICPVQVVPSTRTGTQSAP